MIITNTAGPEHADAAAGFSEYVNSRPGNMKRIRIPQENEPAENVWAEQLSDSTFKIKNAPIFTNAAKWGDTIRAIPDAANPKLLDFVEVVEPSNHAALVAIGPLHERAVQSLLMILQSGGAVVERWEDFLAVISMPKPFDLPDIEHIFGKKVPLLFVAPPGGWVFEVVRLLHTGKRAEANKRIAEVSKRFWDSVEQEHDEQGPPLGGRTD